MTFFDEKGILNFDEMVVNHPSWQKIMADGVVTAEEIAEQANSIDNLLHKMDDKFNDEQKQFVVDLLTETSVLFAAHHVYQLQELVRR